MRKDLTDLLRSMSVSEPTHRAPIDAGDGLLAANNRASAVCATETVSSLFAAKPMCSCYVSFALVGAIAMRISSNCHAAALELLCFCCAAARIFFF